MSDTDSDSDMVKDFLVESYENLDRLLASKTGPVAAAGGPLVTKRCATSGRNQEENADRDFSHDSHACGGLPPRMTTSAKLGPTPSTFFWPSASPSFPP